MTYQLYSLNVDSKKLYNHIKENIENLVFVSTTTKGVNSSEVEKKLKAHSVLNTFITFSAGTEWYNLYEQLVASIHDYIKRNNIETSKQLWLRCTPNYLIGKKPCMASHNHGWDIMGYICLDGQNCDTVFTDSKDGSEIYRIKNIPGQLYLSHANDYHHVKCDSNLDEPRITLGIDVCFDGEYMSHEYNFMPIPKINSFSSCLFPKLV